MPDMQTLHIDKSVAEEKKVRKCPTCGSTLSSKEVAANYCDSCDTSISAEDASMSNTTFRDFTEEERKKLAKSGHALPDGSFPIQNRSDLENAVRAIGRAKDRAKAMAHIKSRAADLGATDMLPDEWSSKMSIDFSDTTVPRVEGDKVIRNGRIFILGNYEDKNFSLSESEADNAIANFQPAPLNVEHIPSIFDGKLGNVTKLWRNDQDLFAEYTVPKWLYEVTQGEPIKVSAEWDRQSKTLIGTGLVLNPRVQSAAMMAAFSNLATTTADFAHRGIASLHDMAVHHGAECGGKSMFAESAKFMTPEDLKTIQKVHDCCKGDGDKHCDMMKSRENMYSTYSNNVTTTTTTEARTERRADKEKNTMGTWWDNLKARFSSKEEAPPKEEIARLLFADSKSCDDDMDDDDEKDGKKGKKGDGDKSDAKGDKTMMSAEDQAKFTAIQTELEAVKANFAAQQLLFTQQQETITKQQEILAATQATFATQQKDAQFAADNTKIEGWKSIGKMTPAEADEWRKIAQESPAAFAAAVPALEARTPMTVFGRGLMGVVDGETARVNMGTANPDGDKLINMTTARMKETGEAYHVAFSAVCKANPALASAYRDAEMSYAPNGSGKGE